jgi:putative membrane protein
LISRAVQVAVIGVALLVATSMVPAVTVTWGDDGTSVAVTLLFLALVFGLVNAFIRPLARIVRIPLDLVTLGLFSVALNAGLLLVSADLADRVAGPIIVVGAYPPVLDFESMGAAITTAAIISIISTTLRILIPDP